MSDLKVQPELTIDFLRKSHPEHARVLTWIAVDRQGIVTKTFQPDEERELAAAIVEYADWNTYYALNVPMADLSKKAAREDIYAMRWVHSDLDPRAKLDAKTPEELAAHIVTERARLIALLNAPPTPIPPPTACVDSGGGYQPLWLLAEPLILDGDVAKAEEAKSYNLAVEIALGGDHCHDVSRIMRLPGSVNWPDQRKRKRGRIPRLSTLLWFEADRVYPLSVFPQARRVQTASSRGGHGFESAVGARSPTVPRVSGNLARLKSVQDLPDTVRSTTKVIIVQGRDPDEDGPPDRSRLTLRVACDLVRAGVSDDVIFSILTDPEFGISAHAIAQGSGKERCANRAIEHAKEIAIDPALREMNERHAVVENAGGRCRIIEELFDPAFKRFALTMQSFDDFRNRYSHRRVTCGTDAKGRPVEKPLGQWWIDQPARKQFRSIVFAPGQEIEGSYNMWRGFAVEPQPGTKHQRFMDHMRDDLCAGDPIVYDYLVNWMARAVQFPAQQGEVAIVIRGKKGSGKGTFARAFGGLFGRHFWAVSDAKHIVGNFNAHLRDCIVLFGDEAFWAGDKKHESVLKALITEPSLVIEPKGVDSVIAPNYVHLIMASNEQWVVPASYDERRFLVLDVNPAHMGEAAYWDAINADLKNGALNNLLHELQTRDISNFNHRSVPKTEALVDQKIHSMDTDQEWWFRKLTDGTLMPTHAGWAAPVPKDALIDDYLTYAQKRGVGKRTSATQLARSIERWTPGLKSFQGQFKGRDLNGDPVIGTALWWQFPELEICREAFGKQNGGPFVWKDIEVEAKSARPDPF